MKSIKQRPDYTFKHNQNLGRHGWLRLTPAYSVKIVEDASSHFDTGATVFEPFSGTGTTPLVLGTKGVACKAVDINPFLVWLGNAKLKKYTKKDIDKYRAEAGKLLNIISNANLELDKWKPPMFKIERWWERSTLDTLSEIRSELVKMYGEPNLSNHHGCLLWIAFCRLVIETSSAAFNHVSMSFQEGVTHYKKDEILEIYKCIFEGIFNSSLGEYADISTVEYADSITNSFVQDKFHGVITSPPYPNRISYIRELRPYMYWTGFLSESRQAGEIDWRAVGGTWGIATSRLKEWKPRQTFLPQELQNCVTLIEQADNKNADLMAKYVSKYFDDMYTHFETLKSRLNPGAKLTYIIGNSAFYGIMVPSELIYMATMDKLGYKFINSEIIRKRNSKRGLFEYRITGAL